jgi:hypothetical protein
MRIHVNTELIEACAGEMRAIAPDFQKIGVDNRDPHSSQPEEGPGRHFASERNLALAIQPLRRKTVDSGRCRAISVAPDGRLHAFFNRLAGNVVVRDGGKMIASFSVSSPHISSWACIPACRFRQAGFPFFE